MKEKYPGFNAFMEKIGIEEVDNMGKVEAMQLAFLGGRIYESERDLEALGKIKIQAD